MGLGEMWSKTLVYFGIAEEEEWDEDGYLTDEELQRAYADRPNVRRLAPRRVRREDFDDWTDPEPATARTSVLRPAPQREPPDCGREREGAPRAAAELQRRAADRLPVQGGRARHPQPPGLRPGSLQAADRLRERPDLCPRR